MKTRAMVFDLDDTLIPSTRIYASALKAIGIDPQDPIFCAARLEVKKKLGTHVAARNRILYFKKYFEIKEGTTQIHATLQAMQDYENALCVEVARFWTQSGRLHFLSQLSKKYMIAVVTNENLRTQLLKLRRLQPETWLDHLVTSEEVGLEKPSPMPFQIALETMNLKASDCTFISDSIENDLETARELGFQCVWTTEFLETKSKSPFRTISKIEELDESI